MSFKRPRDQATTAAVVCLALVYGGSMVGVTMAPAKVFGAEELSRHEILTKLKRDISAIRTYRCSMRIESFEKEPPAVQDQLFWYKAPGFMRILQRGPFRKGAVLVIRPDGSIRAHPGGVLSFVKVSLRPDDPRLLGVTGDSALTADYGSIVKAALDAEPTVRSSRVRPDHRDGRPVLVVESFCEGPVSLYRMVVDTTRPAILELERYKGARLLSRVTWKDIVIDEDVPEDLFDL
jgi:hypothetical protein